MPFAGLLRRPSSRVAPDSSSPTASTSYHGSTSIASSSKPRRSHSTRERLAFGRTSKPHTSTDTGGDLLYLAQQIEPNQRNNRGSHYSVTEDHGIGEAPSHAHSLNTPSIKRPSAATSPSISPLPHTPSLPTTTTDQVNQYDRLFGLAGSSASVSPRRAPFSLPNPPLPPSSTLASTSLTPSVPSSSSAHYTPSSSSQKQATSEPVSTVAAPSASLLRRKSTKSRSPFPPAAASTGTSSTHRDRSTMASSVSRRPSLRRRNGSTDSAASRTEKIVQQMSSSTPPVEASASRSDSIASVATPNPVGAPAAATAPSPEPTAPANNTSSTSSGRFARLFGRRKSISGPMSVTSLPKPDLIAHPVPALRDVTSSVNKGSPPLAVITGGWQGSADALKSSKADSDLYRPVSPRTVAHHDASATVPGASSAQQQNGDSNTKSRTLDSEISKVSAFIFPSRPSLSNESAVQKDALTSETGRPRQLKHSTSRSLPLASMTISSPIPAMTSPESAEPSAIPVPQRRPGRMGRSMSLSHRKSSRSFSMIGSIFGSNSQAHDEASSPPLPQSASTLSQKYPPTERRESTAPDSSASNHSRRPSLRARLRIGRSADQGVQRPTTPEIESWKQRSIDPIEIVSPDVTRKSRASIDGVSRPKPAEMPVKITRSKSVIRRKPPPEIKQEEIDSSSSTPVYGRTFRALEVDHDAGSPLGGSLASSPATQPAALVGSISDVETSPKLAACQPVPASSSERERVTRSDSEQVHGLGLIGASIAAQADAANTSVPSIDIRLSTPPAEGSAAPSIAKDAQRKLNSASSPSMGGKRLSSGMHSVADTSLSVDRPWSLISASEADTPLLKLRKLVVDTNASDESRDEDDASDRLFFRPLNGAGRVADVSQTADIKHEPSSDILTNTTDRTEEAVEVDLEQMRSSSQTSARSDTKHEAASVHSSGSSTLRAARSVAAQSSVSDLSVASGALSDASQASTIRMRNLPANISQTLDSLYAVPAEAAERDADSVGPLPAKSPAASQHSLRTRQHRRDGSTGSTYSQSTIQQARRASTASRLTARSSGHWSESRLSEDALSALEAEVGQARRAEVVALGKGRVKDWVGCGGADRSLPTTEAPTLSRSNTLRKKSQANVAATLPASAGNGTVDEREAQRQKSLNAYLSRKLQQLSDAQIESDTAMPMASDMEIRDIPDEESEVPSPSTHQALPTNASSNNANLSASNGAQVSAPRFARLSAFHDRKMLGDDGQLAVETAAPSVGTASQAVEETIRLGRAPSKRVRRNVDEAKSAGEAVMVLRETADSAPRSASGSSVAQVLAAARHRRRSASMSSRKASSSTDQMNPMLVPALPTTSLLSMESVLAPTESGSKSHDNVGTVEAFAADTCGKQNTKQRSFATSEEAARAKQQELVEREKRLADKEAKRQIQLQEKYAKKKQSDPLLAARLALAGLQPSEAVPKLKSDYAAGATHAVSRTTLFSSGLQVPELPGRHASSLPSAGLLFVTPSATMTRKNSIAGSVSSFHTALDVPADEFKASSVTASPKPMDAVVEAAADASFASKASSEVRPDTSYSVASSLAADFEFPVPPQRMKEQLSDDGTLLSRAGLQESPLQQQWRERRHYLPKSQGVLTPPRDSSLRDRTSKGSPRRPHVASIFQSEAEVQSTLPESRTMPKLASVSPLDSVKQSAALRRSRSVGYNNRDLRRMTREQMLQDAAMHASPRSLQQWDSVSARGLGIDIDEPSPLSGSRRYSNASGSATPSTVVAPQRQPIAA